jgi:hypothetical protein
MWKGDNLGKHKFFFWLLLKDRLSTRNLLRRKNMHLTSYLLGILNANRKIRKRTDNDVAFTREYSRVSIFHRELKPLDRE